MKRGWRPDGLVLAGVLASSAVMAQGQEPSAALELVDATIPVKAPGSDEPGPSQAPVVSTNRLVEEVIVTSQKREERLQDVPISVQAFSQEKLEVLNIDTVQQVQRATPGFTVTNSSGFNVTFLRGVGSDAFLPGVDSSVPFYMDGIPLLAVQATSDTLGRVERVEVLKGPQGTLFGRNATGGAVNIVTPEPDQNFSADIKYDLGLDKYHRWSTQAYVNIPMTQDIAMSVTGFYSAKDNVVKNESIGAMPDLYGRGARAKLRWSMSDALSLSVSASVQDVSTDGGLLYQNVRPAPVLSAVLPADPKLDRTVSLDTRTEAVNRSHLFGATLNWKTDFADIKLIGSQQKSSIPELHADFDGTARPVAEAHAGGGINKQVYHQDTLELQILSNATTPFSERLEWVAGLFYLKSDGGLTPVTFNVAPHLLNLVLPGAGPAVTSAIDQALTTAGLPAVAFEGIQLANYGSLDNRSYSIYGQGTYHLIDTVDLTGGIRYQYEERKLVGSRTTYPLANGNEVELPFPQADTPTLKPKLTSGRAALQWRPLGPDTQFYASWARGYKNPTYNTVNLLGNTFGTMVPVKSEQVDTYEIGTKTTMLDGAAQLNAAAFYTIQQRPLSGRVSLLTGGVVDYINAGRARIRGAEFDTLVLPMPDLNPGLVVTAGGAYIDAIFTDFVNGRGYDDTTGLAFGEGGATLPPRDLSGNRIPRVPKWSWVASLSQRIDFSEGQAIELGLDTSYSSKFYFLPQNSEYSTREALQLYNAHLSYFYQPWGLELTAYCNNLTDEIYAESALVTDFGTTLIVNNDPRMFGIRAKLSF